LFPSTYASLVEAPLVLGRVCAQDRGIYVVTVGSRELRAQVDGKTRHHAAGPSALPVAGDYVALDARPLEGTATIRRVLARSNLFARRAAGGAYELQPIAANLDALFVTLAADGDFNLRRIERYLVAAAAFGIPVALALTKVDLVDDPESYLTAARSVAGNAPVVALRALEPDGLEPLEPFRGADRTLAFVGSSGVGKSTIVNALLAEERLATGGVRAHDGRGRHTTTRRELVRLSDGTSVIDTPGMREFALADSAGGVGDAFDDVEELAASCRFRDCRHAAEPGCAVRDGVDPARLASWRKLGREAAFEARKEDSEAARAERARWKAIHRANRARYRERGR
jgi:ribosome biogenesis GTPase / thiamine phosphate phosphatase